MTKWFLKFASYKSKDDIFNKILSGEKTIETRPRNPGSKKDYSKIAVGDILVFKSLDSERNFEKTVTFVHPYISVNDMVDSENEEKILPGVGSKENLLKVYEDIKKKWGKDYANKLEKFGIVAIGFK